MMPRPSSIVAVSAFLILAGALGSCSRRPSRPNVILISIDSLRADHLGCYGYGPDTSPAIDALAKRGVRFDVARSSTTWTLAAHMSLMTGMPNELHGVVNDVNVLDENRHLLAESFRAAGYRTAGFFGGPYLHAHFGFARGFDTYENCGVPTAYDEPSTAAGDEARDLAAQHVEASFVVTADRIEQAAEAWLDQGGGEPFFLFLHHWDVHFDYMAPAEIVRRFAPDYAGDLEPRDFMTNPRIHAGMDPVDLAYLIACYDAEIYWVDRHVERLVAKLHALGVAGDTYIVVTSDHGEEFFDHGQKGHRNNLYEETLRVPLIIAGPNVAPNVVVHEPVRLYDVKPTILELAGLPAVDEVYGTSLVPLMRGDADAELRDLPICAELTNIPTDPHTKQRVFDKRFASGRSGYKSIHSIRREFDEARHVAGRPLQPPAFEIYDLNVDPGESKDLSASNDARVESVKSYRDAFLEQLRGAGARLRRGESRLREVPPDLEEILRQNGYTGGSQGDDGR